MKIAVAGTGYVGLSIATLLSQHHEVMAVDIIPEKVEKINKRISPIQDEYIEKYLAEKELNLTATLDAEAAYKDADFVVIVNIPFKQCTFFGNSEQLNSNKQSNHFRSQSALIHGKKAAIVGRICMDQFMVDVTDIPEAREYEEV